MTIRRLRYVVDRPLDVNSEYLLSEDQAGFQRAIEAIPGLSVIYSTASTRSQEGVVHVSAADRRGLFYLQAVALVFDRLAPGRASYKVGDSVCSVATGRNEPPLLLLESLGWIANNTHLWNEESLALAWVNRMLTERLAATEIEGLNATIPPECKQDSIRRLQEEPPLPPPPPAPPRDCATFGKC